MYWTLIVLSYNIQQWKGHLQSDGLKAEAEKELGRLCLYLPQRCLPEFLQPQLAWSLEEAGTAGSPFCHWPCSAARYRCLPSRGEYEEWLRLSRGRAAK